jgi:putative sterol carrier protein
MPLVFNPASAGNLQATIQFNVSGLEPGCYYLEIKEGVCQFNLGQAAHPTLTINTPSEIWQRVSSGQLSGQNALFQGLYTVEGDARLLLRFSEIFPATSGITLKDTSEPPRGRLFEIFRGNQAKALMNQPAGKRPAGPLKISGMGWMNIFWIPWTLFWILFDIRSVSLWLSTGIPLAMMTIIILYRAIFNRPVWMETASWLFFLVALWLGPLWHVPVFLTWDSVTGSFFVGLLWLISMSPLVNMPFCGEYSKWGFRRALWTNSQFIEINLTISLVWGWQFIIASGFGIIATMVSSLFVVFSVVRYLLMVPATVFTIRYQKTAMQKYFGDIDGLMAKQRVWAYIGLAITLVAMAITWFVLKPGG